MYKFSTTLLLVIGISCFSCSKPQAPDYKDIKNFKVNNLGFDKSNVSLDLVYYNPNNYGIDLRKVNCDVYVDKNFLGRFMLDTVMHIPRNVEFTVPARMDVDMRNVFKNALNVLFSREVLIGAKGSTRIGKGGIFVTIPFDYEGRHKVEF